jgi:hypothetical protein
VAEVNRDFEAGCGFEQIHLGADHRLNAAMHHTVKLTGSDRERRSRSKVPCTAAGKQARDKGGKKADRQESTHDVAPLRRIGETQCATTVQQAVQRKEAENLTAYR